MDRLILKKNGYGNGQYRSVNIPLDLYERISQIKEDSGLSYTAVFTSMLEFALERVEVQE